MKRRPANSVNVTIGNTKKRSGSAIVATTGSGIKADSAMVAIRTFTDYKSRQCHCDHRQATIGITRADSVKMTSGSRNRINWKRSGCWSTRADSAFVAIRDNNNNRNKPEEIRLLVHRGGQQEQQADSAIVAIRGNTTGVDFRTDSVMVTTGTNKAATAINLPESQECGSQQFVQADSHSERPLHPIHSVGRSGESHLHVTSYY
jgi:hypothetical protein